MRDLLGVTGISMLCWPPLSPPEPTAACQVRDATFRPIPPEPKVSYEAFRLPL
jgi:hypothetical protein